MAKPGAKVLVLELTRPQAAWQRLLYWPVLNIYVPVMGTLLSGHNDGYKYLRDTIKGFWYNDSVYPNGFTKGKQQASLFVMKKGNIDSGFGKIYWLNGNRYQGEIKKGQMHGKGKLTISKNGDLPVFDILGECVYEGEFSKGYMQGSGKITRDGILEKEGQFEMNV